MKKLVLFPHGTRIKPFSNVNIKPGIFAIYKHLNIPIVPVYMNSGYVWDRKGLIKRPGKVKVIFFDFIKSGYNKKRVFRNFKFKVKLIYLIYVNLIFIKSSIIFYFLKWDTA